MLENTRGVVRKYAPALAAFGAATLAHGQASAQAAAAFTAAIGEATTDIGTYGAALVGLAAVGVAFMIGVKYVKKIRGAA